MRRCLDLANEASASGRLSHWMLRLVNDRLAVKDHKPRASALGSLTVRFPFCLLLF